jgi:phosphatidylinositol alpha-mannosyltransferase
MICPYSLGVWGGVQTQVLGLARAIRAQGLPVQVLAPCDGLPPEPWVTPLGDSIPYAQNGSLAPLAPDAAAQLRVLAAIWDERFDLLHLHEPLAPGPTLTSLVVKPVPIIGTFHASGSIGAYKWMGPVVRRLARRLDLAVAVSPEAADMASRYLGGSYDVLYNGIEIDRFADAEPSSKSGPTVLFLARHEPRKGLAVLLAAAQLLGPDVTFWIGGTGPETDELKTKYAHDDRLVWLGEISNSEKESRLKAADVFCVPSLGGESFGVVLLEGMAAGTAVVASDIEAYRVVSRDGRDVGLFETGDSQALARQLELALNHGSEVSARIESGASRAQDFSMERLATEYVDRFQRLVL